MHLKEFVKPSREFVSLCAIYVLVGERENYYGDGLQPACFGTSETILLPASDYDAVPEAEVLVGLGLHVI